MEEKVENTEVTETSMESTSNEPEVAEEGYEELTDSTEEEQEESVNEGQAEESAVEELAEDEKPMYSKKDVEDMVKKRLKRERKRYEPLFKTLNAGGFEEDTPESMTQALMNSYREQNIEVPDFSTAGLSEKESKALAKIDAEEIIELGEDVMEERFIELYNKKDRTAREEAEMQYIGQEASLNSAKKQFVEMGLKPEEILNDKKFVEFASKINPDVPLKEVYEMYTQLNGNAPTKPKSTGSVKTGAETRVKTHYTPTEISKLTMEDLDKPGVFEAVRNSMTKK